MSIALFGGVQPSAINASRIPFSLVSITQRDISRSLCPIAESSCTIFPSLCGVTVNLNPTEPFG